ncbi:MAG: NAD(P)-dependent oxidoreductase [Rhodospirillaceae bacterium]|jgi:3-hydroxyisobutyrate dehydrogenase|nr:NAD(P)-dependent oxidoreductase [Rhodospirillaceae bacterium]MBT5665544.1 NAD(P)-dependent oxidoreductase [Rhodospirillaceae bacterium]MBT5810046.1 NAD(P)-dependent oxidoreductase [Rhodospirillaceae bacterium]
MATEIGFIGVGNMGGPMVANLLAGGYAVRVYDPNKAAVDDCVAKGASTASSPKDLADQVETVLVCLPTPQIVQAVALGENGLSKGSKVKTYIDLSTTGPQTSVPVAEGLKEAGIVALDAPVSGGVIGAVSGSLAVMVSGPHNDFGHHRPMLEKIGKNVFYVGDKIGMGQMMKLLNNLLSGTALAVTAEAVTLGVKAGLDPKLMIDIFNASSGRNTATETKFPNSVLTRKFDGGFGSALMFKDVRLCLEEAEAQGITMFVGNATRQAWSFALNQGEAGEDSTQIIEHYENLAGVEWPEDKS